MDDDGNGFISKEELKKMLGLFVDDSDIDAIIAEVDKNGDGKIDLKEFIAAAAVFKWLYLLI